MEVQVTPDTVTTLAFIKEERLIRVELGYPRLRRKLIACFVWVSYMG